MERGSVAEPSWAALLADTPFAAALSKGAPLWIARGAPPQVVFATPAALAAFDARALDDFAATAFSRTGPGGRRFRKLAEGAPGLPPRLERVRFFVDRKAVLRDWLCARFVREGETYFVAAEPVADAESIARPQEAAAQTPTQRFVWRLDGEGRFAAPDPELLSRLGASAPRAGETLDALSARAGLDDAWKDAVAARLTFSRLRVVWRLDDAKDAMVAQLSGAPAFGPGEAYLGFRGFGLLSEDTVTAPAPPRAPATPQAGDAAALIRLLQRQHAPGDLPATEPGAANTPALAVISALAALLKPKTERDAKPARRASTQSGAEIFVLHPQSGAPAPASGESVELTPQERQNFKDIAVALSPNLRRQGPTPEPASTHAEPAAPASSPETPTSDDLAALVDALPIAVLVMRGEEPLFANKLLLNLTGYRDFADFHARGGAKAIFESGDPRKLAPGGAVSALPLVTEGGRLLSVDVHVRDAIWGGEPADLVALRRSYEAERQEEVRVLEREAEMHAARASDYAVALEAARDGMLKLDRSGRILAMNKGAERLFGRLQGEAAGESVLTLFSPAAQTDVQGALDRLVAGGAGRETLTAEARADQGRVFPAQLDMGRLSGEPEPEYFVLLTDRSDTEASAAEVRAALAQSEKESLAKTELLSSVSHEMRTPLHAVLGFAEVMLEERFGPIGNERYREYMRDIHASGRHVLSLANDLLDLTRIKLGKMELQFTPLDVNTVVRECVTLMQPQAARERVIMRLSLADRLPQVMADERSLRQIMLNLMANAVKYNEPGGQVIVSTALDDSGAVILRVRDTGVGMNESELAIALEPFRRVPGARSGEGAGLGLPLTKALVEANHADFTIKSRKDQGTLVEIAFPVSRAAQ